MAVTIRRLLLPALAFLAGAFALGHSALLYRENRNVAQHGLLAPVQAIQNSKKIKRSGDRLTFRADISFTRRDGQAATARAAISEQSLKGFAAGQPVQVRYLADQPDVIRVAGEEDEGSSWLLVGVGCAAWAYAGIAVFWPRRRGKQPASRRLR
jgi:Protein of unknown function (DUF3592)